MVPTGTPSRGFRLRAWSSAPGNGSLLAGLLILLPIALTAVLAPALTPHDPNAQFPEGLDADGMPLPPCGRFPFGTDGLGRDTFSRLLYGARVSLVAGTAAMLIATVVGVIIGLTAGFYGGWVDTLLMRFTEVMMTIPAVLLAMALAGLMDGRVVSLLPGWISSLGGEVKFERGLVTVFVVVGAVSWTGMARVVRGQVRAIVERPFIEAARAVGCSPARIVWRHIFPNVLPTVLVLAAMCTAWTITLEAGLSFLGIGVPPPTASWGRMISESQSYLLVAPWLVASAGGAILLTVLGFNLLGHGLQERWNPDRGSAR